MIGWVDASSGASGDMLLGALVGAGVPPSVMQDAIDAVSPEPVRLAASRVTRQGLVATRCTIDAPVSHVSRSWSDVSALLHHGSLEPAVRERALEVFERLAVAEGSVHGVPPEEVHFHEVGALDAIADVVGVCAGLDHLGLEELFVSAIAVGSGRVHAEHGSMPVPAPAVAELLRGRPSLAGPGSDESCTPTGAALLTSQASHFSAQPLMTVQRIGCGAGSRNPGTHANILRLLVGERPHSGADHPVLVMETNIDDMDPRLWPDLLAALMRAGAADVWLTPVLMKKGRPAHTLSVLVPVDRAEPIRSIVFTHTSTIGVRESPVQRHVLARASHLVEVDGHQIRVKTASNDDGTVVNAQPEYDDVVAVASATGRPPKQVLNAATAAAQQLLRTRR